MRSEMFAVLCALLMAFQTTPVLAQTAPLVPGTRTISVSGHGESKTKPDLMVISFAVYTTASGDQSTRLQAQKSHDVIDALRASSEAKVKIETSDYSLSFSDQPENTIAAQPEVSGWTFKATITAGSENMANLGAVLDAGLAAGATDVAGSGFDSFPVLNPIPSQGTGMTHNTPKFATEPSSPIPGAIAVDQSDQPGKQMPSVSVEIETQGATADEAVKQGIQIGAKVTKALRSKLGPHGVLRLDNFAIIKSPPAQGRPIGSYRPVQQRKIYTARTTIAASTSDLDALGALLEAGMKAGATQLNSVSFTVSDPQAAGNDAIAQASKSAQGKAEALADSMKVKLGKILSISTNAQVQPQTIYGGYMLETMAAGRVYAARDAATLPVLPKELGVVADIRAVYEIQ